MKEIFLEMKNLFAGKWAGEGFAKFPTIDDTHYTEQLEYRPDEFKDSIFFEQKTWYKNHTPQNGHTVFWDTGFIILKDEKIVLHSAQVGGRIETYEFIRTTPGVFTFNSTAILADPKTMRSQRIFTINGDSLHYELNMATHAAPDFQNHLSASLKKLIK
jgi:THAP4-like, heme-binding beta-barrel domain